MTSGRNRKGGDELSAGQTVLGRYRVERLLDEGGMASIYLAVDLRTNQPVAIKCLYKIYANNDIVRARFIDEGRIQMMLQHPNIVRVYQFMEQPTLAFVMEFIQGQTLEELLLERGVMEMSEILEIMVPVLSALGLAHSRHIVHRDLKPSNILIDKSRGAWHPKVMDFGVAKLKRTKNLTATGTTVGTLHYMSPEQIVGSKKIDGRADIYSLGITLYKLCTGDVPFNASTEFALMMAQVETPPTPPSAINPRISREFEAVILKALEKKSAKRYQNIKEFTSALLELRDARGYRTRDTIDVPESLIEYAMRADRVAVDRTDEIMLSTKDLDSRELDDQVRTLERERPEQLQQLANALSQSPYSPITDDEEDEEMVDATVRISSRGNIQAATLGAAQDDGVATIELESLKLDSTLVTPTQRGASAMPPPLEDDQLQTMDMALDITTRSRLTTDTLAQLMRESEQRQIAQQAPPSALPGQSAQGEEDQTAPMRVKTAEIAALAQRGTPSQHHHSNPAPASSQAARRPAATSGGHAQVPSSERPNPFARPVQTPASPPPDPRSSPFNRPPPTSPLPSQQDYAPYVVGQEGVDTSERTVPFTVQRGDLPAGASPQPGGFYPERSDPSMPATITADRYPEPHPAWHTANQGQQEWQMTAQGGYTPPARREEASFLAQHGSAILIGVLTLFGLICLVLIALILF